MSEQPEQFEEEEELSTIEMQLRQLSAGAEIGKLLHPDEDE